VTKEVQRWADFPCDRVPTNRDDGYAQIRGEYVHIVAWEEANGPVPVGLTLDHLCRRRNCRQVHHLEPVTMRENTLRGTGPSAVNARKEACPKCQGAFSVSPDGKRVCRPCKQVTQSNRRRTRGGREGMNRVG
jgi:hypothetical protein